MLLRGLQLDLVATAGQHLEQPGAHRPQRLGGGGGLAPRGALRRPRGAPGTEGGLSADAGVPGPGLDVLPRLAQDLGPVDRRGEHVRHHRPAAGGEPLSRRRLRRPGAPPRVARHHRPGLRRRVGRAEARLPAHPHPLPLALGLRGLRLRPGEDAVLEVVPRGRRPLRGRRRGLVWLGHRGHAAVLARLTLSGARAVARHLGPGGGGLLAALAGEPRARLGARVVGCPGRPAGISEPRLGEAPGLRRGQRRAVRARWSPTPTASRRS